MYVNWSKKFTRPHKKTIILVFASDMLYVMLEETVQAPHNYIGSPGIEPETSHIEIQGSNS